MTNIQGRAGNGEVVGVMLRMPRPLRDEIKAEADKVGRSINTHLVMTLMARGAVDEVEGGAKPNA